MSRWNETVEQMLLAGSAHLLPEHWGKETGIEAHRPPEIGMLIDDALEVDDDAGRVSTPHGRPWMPFEVIL